MAGLMGGGGGAAAGGSGAAGGGFGARMQNIWQDPLFQMGMGVLGGNEGRTGDQAFRNSLRGGMQGVQAGQRNVAAIQARQAQTQMAAMQRMQMERAEEERRRLAAAAPQLVQGIMSSDPDIRRQSMMGLASMNPSALGGILSGQMAAPLNQAKTAYYNAQAASALAPDEPRTPSPITLLHPDGRQVSMRPNDPQLDDRMQEGFVRVGLGVQAPSPGALFPGTKSQMGTAVQELGFIEDVGQEVDTWIKSIEADPSLVGPVGGMRSTGQTMLGMAEDLTGVVSPKFANGLKAFTDSALEAGVADEMPAAERHRLFTDPKLSTRKMFENRLGLALARVQYGQSGRIPVEVIRRSINDAKLTGATSSRQVLSRLKTIKDRFESYKGQLSSRLGEGPGERVEKRAAHPQTGESMIKIDGKWYYEE